MHNTFTDGQQYYFLRFVTHNPEIFILPLNFLIVTISEVCSSVWNSPLPFVEMGRYSGKSCRLLAMLSLTLSFMLVEVIVGHMTHSLALIADAFHMLSDTLALIVGLASIKVSFQFL